MLPGPGVLQVTPVLEVPVTLAVNVTDPPALIVGFDGVTLTVIGTPTVTIALADADAFTTLAAVTVKLCPISRLAGAV
jgi:hypothetical protein